MPAANDDRAAPPRGAMTARRRAAPARRAPARRTPARRGPLALLVHALLRIVAVLLLAWLGGFAWFVATLPGAAPLAITTDAVVVLTGGAGRVARGVEVLEAKSASRMLVSGVGAGIGKGALAASVAARLKLFATRVDLGHGAVDTRSNAVETTAWVARHGYRSLRLVTSAAHMRRARLEFDTRMPATVTLVADAVPTEPGADSIAREFSKYILRVAALAAGAA